MIFFNKNSSKSITAIVIITIVSVYAEPVAVDTCISKLNEAGYTSSNNGLKNYVEKTFTKFTVQNNSIQSTAQSIVQSKAQSITELSFQTSRKCMSEQWNKEVTYIAALEEYYDCNLLIYSHELPKHWETPLDYCKSQISASSSNDQSSRADIDKYQTCADEIIKDLLYFAWNIDFYAFSMWIKKNSSMFNTLKPNTQKYVDSLTPKDIEELADTSNWCKIFACEVELYEAGFESRYSGFNNFRYTLVYKYQINCAALSGLAKIYCEDLLKKFEPTGFYEVKIPMLEDIGTYLWCKKNQA